MSEEVENTEVEAPPIEQQIEDAAREQGWRPDGKNSEGESVSALDFLANGSKFHRDLKGTVDELKQENQKLYKVVAEHITNTSKKEYESEKARIDAEIQNAKDEGDTDKAVQLAEQRATLQEPEPIDPGVEKVQQWVDRQDWWSNKEMAADATAMYGAIAQQIGDDDPDLVLPKVEEKIKRLYPEHFEIKNPNTDKGAGDSGSNKKTPVKFSLNDLDEDEARHVDQFVKMGMSEDKILESIKSLRSQRGI